MVPDSEAQLWQASLITCVLVIVLVCPPKPPGAGPWSLQAAAGRGSPARSWSPRVGCSVALYVPLFSLETPRTYARPEMRCEATISRWERRSSGAIKMEDVGPALVYVAQRLCKPR